MFKIAVSAHIGAADLFGRSLFILDLMWFASQSISSPSFLSSPLCLFALVQSVTDTRHWFRTETASLDLEGKEKLSWVSSPQNSDNLSKQFHEDVEEHKGQNRTLRGTTDQWPGFQTGVPQHETFGQNPVGQNPVSVKLCSRSWWCH